MKVIRHRSTNGILKPPSDLPPEVFEGGPVPLTTTKVQDKFTAMKTYWQPTEEDIANILAGGILELTIYGKTHPVMGLKVTMP
jgi:hypothetical protein